MNIMELNYSVQGEERRKLVQIVSEIINTAAVYKKVPTCAYDIGTFTVSKTGVLSWTEDTDVATVKTVVAGLQMMGLNAKEETKTVKKVFEMRPQPQLDAPKQPQEQPKDEPDKQSYIFDTALPYWIIYRNDIFDTVCAKMDFDRFTVFRDRQITNPLLKTTGEIRVLKSRNVSDDGQEIINIEGYDAFINEDEAKVLSVYYFLNRDDVYLTPNMTYYPRVMRKPKGIIVNGSVMLSQTTLARNIPNWSPIPAYDGINDFTMYGINDHKLAVVLKLDENFLHDMPYVFEKYVTDRLVTDFAHAEEQGFIQGNGITEPVGILNDGGGAAVGSTAQALTYDSVIDLFFSVDKEYRKNAVWMMNDATALALRKLKDADGNYLWNGDTSDLLGRKVYISNYMPDAEVGGKPIAFGDYSFYWVVDRMPMAVRTLREKFFEAGQIGYLAYERLDGKLIRPDAIKVLKIAE